MGCFLFGFGEGRTVFQKDALTVMRLLTENSFLGIPGVCEDVWPGVD